MKPHTLRTTLLVLGITAGAMPALADNSEVIIRANRFSTYRGDAAFAVTDLSQDTLQRSGLDQTLKRETQASLFRRQSSLTANPTIQGISLRAIGPSGAGRALVTLDGVPQNDPFGGWVIWATLPQDAIDNVHVLKGAGGGAYGAGALTGVIDVSLTPARGTHYGRVRAGEDANWLVAGGVGLGDVAVHYSARNLNGDMAVRAPQAGAADGPVTGRDSAWLANGSFDLCDGCGTLSVIAGTYESRRDTGLVGATATSTGGQLAVSLTKQPTPDALGWRLQAWHRDSGLSNRSVAVVAGRTGTSTAADQIKTPATGDGINAALRHQSNGTEWEIGLDARVTEGESREFYRYMSGAPTRYRVAGGKTTLTGLYAEGSRSQGALTLAAAVRADTWSASNAHRTETDTAIGLPTLQLNPADKEENVLSARLGVAYAFERVIARAAAYNGFRPPSLNELYRPFRVGNDVTEANADLKPETLTGFEIGLRTPGRDRFIDGTLFVNTLKDPIANVTIGVGPGTFPTAGFIPAGGSLRQRRNMGQINAHGAEMRGLYAFGDRLAVSSSATFTHARVDAPGQPANGKRPAQAPEYSVSLGLRSQIGKTQVTADLIHDGEIFEDDLNTLKLEPATRLNVDIGYPLSERLTLNLSIENALDDAIMIQRSGDGTINYDNRRAVSIGLTYRR
jgi:vitamin B12 transporter